MGLGWDKLCEIATDGAPAMAGERKGMASMVCDKVRESGGEAFKFHCIIHQEALCAKTIQLRDVLEDVIKTVNVIKARGLFHKEYKEFLSELDAKYGDVVYHSAVCWLSHGNVLKRFYSLGSEINQFLKTKNQPFHELCPSMAGRFGLECNNFARWSAFMSRSSQIANVITFPHFLKGPLLIQRPKLNQEWANM